MTILRIASTSLAALLLALALTLGAAGVATAAPTGPVAVAPAKINSFDWVSGKPQWSQQNLDRLRRSVFVIGPDGSFQMRQPDGYPTLTGTIAADGSFTAAYRASSGVGTTDADALGQVNVRDGAAPTLNLTYTAGSAMGAHINDTQFGSHASKAYRATMTLRQA